jgi:hypothetical protein
MTRNFLTVREETVGSNATPADKPKPHMLGMGPAILPLPEAEAVPVPQKVSNYIESHLAKAFCRFWLLINGI